MPKARTVEFQEKYQKNIKHVYQLSLFVQHGNTTASPCTVTISLLIICNIRNFSICPVQTMSVSHARIFGVIATSSFVSDTLFSLMIFRQKNEQNETYPFSFFDIVILVLENLEIEGGSYCLSS